MTRSYVFVDVETTGLNDKWDRMIEVAAVVWEDGKVTDSFATLLNPGREIPEIITQITGIDDKMVKKAPRIEDVRSKLNKLIGDRIVVGHNVDFDIGFLKAENMAYGNHKLDTVALASILAPEAGRFGLEHLVRYFDLPQTVAHRAEADARHTIDLFVKLQEITAKQNMAILEEIVQNGLGIGWPEVVFFQDVVQAMAKAAFTGDGAANVSQGKRQRHLFSTGKIEGKILPNPDSLEKEKQQPVDVEAVTGMFKPGSNFSLVFPNFEPRKEQIQMVSAVAGALNNQRHLMVEAGTGTGKSLAYLIPAAFWAQQNDRRVVISTNTINLQDQLINKDVPALNKALPFNLDVAVRKGRSNYVCGGLVNRLRSRGPKDKDEMAVLARVLLWLPKTQTGDVAEISLRTARERQVWREISGEKARCSETGCTYENCAVTNARRRAESAHIIIVNHALLMSDVANENHVLPPFKDLIIDEAHHFESAATNGLSFEADERTLKALLDDLTDNVLKSVQKDLKELPDDVYDKLNNFVQLANRDAEFAQHRLQELFETLTFFMSGRVSDKSSFSQSVRLVKGVRDSAEFGLVRESWANLGARLKGIIKNVGQLNKGIGDLKEADEYANLDFDKDDEYRNSLGDSLKDLEKTHTSLTNIIDVHNEDLITWVESYRDKFSLHAAPLHVGPLVTSHIWENLDTVIMTSATMRTAPKGRYDQANFDYIRDRLSADEEVHELAVGSPFNYKKNTLLYLASDIPEPRQPGYQRKVEEAIVDVAKTLKGRTIVLFTSYKQLTETARIIQPQLAEEGIRVLAQASGVSRQQLTAQFKEPDARAVLLGTRSFWEGVDVPGKPLEAVMIVKLPFDVPSDPIIGARSETFDNPFMEYALPESVLRFRQGFGRLIRRKTDEGAVIVLDKRVLTKRYGELFINSLPECTTLRMRVDRLPEVLERWEKRDRK